VILKQIFVQVANDANGNAVRDGVRASVDTYNNNQQANLGFIARHSILRLDFKYYYWK